MGAARTIAAHELTALWRDGRLRLTAAIVVILLIVAMVSGAQYQQMLTAERARADVAEQERWQDQGSKNPHSAAHYGIYVFKPASPLSLFDRGIEQFAGVGVWLEAHKMNNFVYRPAQDAAPVSRFGELSAATILRQLMPLLIIFAGYAMLAGERERGTLRQLLVSGTTRRVIGLGKLGATLGAMALVLAPAALIGAAVAAFTGVAAEPVRVMVLLLAYAGYLAGWACLTLGVSALARSARVALVLLLALWLFGCILGPRLAGEIAGRAYPVPSEVAYRTALEADLGDAHATNRVEEIKARLLKQYGVSTTAELPVNWRGINLQEGEEHGNEVFDKHFNALYDIYGQQNRLHQFLGFLAPELAIRSLSEAAAGSDLAHHRRFVTAAEDHRRLMQRLLNGDLTQNAREGQDYRSGPELWRSIPPFTYAAPATGEALGQVLPAIAALLAWLVATALLLGFALRRIRA